MELDPAEWGNNPEYTAIKTSSFLIIFINIPKLVFLTIQTVCV